MTKGTSDGTKMKLMMKIMMMMMVMLIGCLNKQAHSINTALVDNQQINNGLLPDGIMPPPISFQSHPIFALRNSGSGIVRPMLDTVFDALLKSSYVVLNDYLSSGLDNHVNHVNQHADKNNSKNSVILSKILQSQTNKTDSYSGENGSQLVVSEAQPYGFASQSNNSEFQNSVRKLQPHEISSLYEARKNLSQVSKPQRHEIVSQLKVSKSKRHIKDTEFELSVEKPQLQEIVDNSQESESHPQNIDTQQQNIKVQPLVSRFQKRNKDIFFQDNNPQPRASESPIQDNDIQPRDSRPKSPIQEIEPQPRDNTPIQQWTSIPRMLIRQSHKHPSYAANNQAMQIPAKGYLKKNKLRPSMLYHDSEAIKASLGNKQLSSSYGSTGVHRSDADLYGPGLTLRPNVANSGDSPASYTHREAEAEDPKDNTAGLHRTGVVMKDVKSITSSPKRYIRRYVG